MEKQRLNISPGTIMAAAAVLLLACLTLHAIQTIARLNSFTWVSGIWTTLAVDLAAGQLYRPLVAPNGFGGTRYFPLQFAGHAGLIRLGADPIVAGLVMSVVWSVFLAWSVYVFLRRVNANRQLAMAGAIASLASAAAYVALTDIRGDVLACALNILGLAMLLPPPGGSGRRIALASLFFVLAFAAKPTAVFIAGAGFLALMIHRDRKESARLIVFTGAGYLLVLALIYVTSDGRVFPVFRTAFAGGTDSEFALLAPVRFVIRYVRHDPIGLALVVSAAAAALGLFHKIRKELPTLALLAAFLMTLVIFATPGTDYNHLLDLNVVAILFLVWLGVAGYMQRELVTGLLTVISLVAAMGHANAWREEIGQSHRTEVRNVVAAIQGRGGPILSQDPLVPIVAGQRPYVLDSWMLRLIAARDQSIMRRLESELRQHEFSAIVLTMDPLRDAGAYLEARIFGQGFVRAMLDSYEWSENVGQFRVYRPRDSHVGRATTSEPPSPADPSAPERRVPGR